MEIRLFFPLWSMTTIIGEVSSAGKKELNKLRLFGSEYLLPYICTKRFKNYPFKITITFYIYSDIETTSLLLLASYIVNEMGCFCLQSADYRVIPTVEILTKKVVEKSGEGCKITLESSRVEKSARSIESVDMQPTDVVLEV